MHDVAPSRKGKKSLTVWLDADLVKDVKLTSVQSDRTVQDAVAGWIKEGIRRDERKGERA